MAASFALQRVALAFCAGQVEPFVGKTIARLPTLWMFQPK